MLMTGWWLNQPIWKNVRKNWIISPNSDENYENKTCLTPPASDDDDDDDDDDGYELEYLKTNHLSTSTLPLNIRNYPANPISLSLWTPGLFFGRLFTGLVLGGVMNKMIIHVMKQSGSKWIKQDGEWWTWIWMTWIIWNREITSCDSIHYASLKCKRLCSPPPFFYPVSPVTSPSFVNLSSERSSWP